MLLIGGANKNLLSEHGDSALALATKANDRKSVQTLLHANVKRITENMVSRKFIVYVFRFTSSFFTY